MSLPKGIWASRLAFFLFFSSCQSLLGLARRNKYQVYVKQQSSRWIFTIKKRLDGRIRTSGFNEVSNGCRRKWEKNPFTVTFLMGFRHFLIHISCHLKGSQMTVPHVIDESSVSHEALLGRLASLRTRLPSSCHLPFSTTSVMRESALKRIDTGRIGLFG